MLRLGLAATVVGTMLAGCGANNPTFTVGGQKLVVKDTGYYLAPYFCNTLAMSQLELRFVEYTPICGLPSASNNDMGMDPTALERRELRITLGQGGHPNMTIPYNVGKVDCVNGIGEDAIATFLHYPAGQRVADSQTQADSGTVRLDSYDPTGVKPAKGSFDLLFGADVVKGNYEIYSCN